MIHALIVAPPGVGKSTLIRRIAAEVGRPLFGFETKKEDALADESLGSPIYIYDIGKNRIQTEGNLLGWCKDHRPTTDVAAFDRYAPKLRQPVPEGHLVVLDELGFMEAKSAPFCAAIMALLDGDAPVIAAVKDKNIPFLERVRTHPNCRCFYLTGDNRDCLFEEVLDFVTCSLRR